MVKNFLVANLILQVIYASEIYLCLFGPDGAGKYTEEVV